MFYFVYIIESDVDQSWYIGYTQDLKQRVKEHNQGKCTYTKKLGRKWRLIYAEFYRSKKDALGREQFLKSGSGRRYIKKQLHYYLLEL